MLVGGCIGCVIGLLLWFVWLEGQKTKVVLQTLFDGIKNMPGVEVVQPMQKQIQQAIDSKDTGKIIRAFHDAVYDQDFENERGDSCIEIFSE